MSQTARQRVEVAIVAILGLAVPFALSPAVPALRHPLVLALGSLVAIAMYLAPKYGWRRWQVAAFVAGAIGLIALFAIQPSYVIRPFR